MQCLAIGGMGAYVQCNEYMTGGHGIDANGRSRIGRYDDKGKGVDRAQMGAQRRIVARSVARLSNTQQSRQSNICSIERGSNMSNHHMQVRAYTTMRDDRIYTWMHTHTCTQCIHAHDAYMHTVQ